MAITSQDHGSLATSPIVQCYHDCFSKGQIHGVPHPMVGHSFVMVATAERQDLRQSTTPDTFDSTRKSVPPLIIREHEDDIGSLGSHANRGNRQQGKCE
jgi:hypothetical protein